MLTYVGRNNVIPRRSAGTVQHLLELYLGGGGEVTQTRCLSLILFKLSVDVFATLIKLGRFSKHILVF